MSEQSSEINRDHTVRSRLSPYVAMPRALYFEGADGNCCLAGMLTILKCR
jgi:hypothetical protein